MKVQIVKLSDIAKHPYLSLSVKDYTLILCPIKEINVYRWVCLLECTYYKENKCPLYKEGGKDDSSLSLQPMEVM